MKGTTNIPGVCILVQDGNKLLFLLREHTGFMDDYYVVPSGHVEANETFTQAAIRELYEEVGLMVAPEHLKHTLTVHRKTSNDERVDAYFLTRRWVGAPKNGEPDKHGDPIWLDMDALPETVMPFVADALQAISQGLTYLEQGW